MPTYGLPPIEEPPWVPPGIILKSLHYENGTGEATFEGQEVRVIIRALAAAFIESGGINYVEWNFHAADRPWFILTIQKRGAESPGRQASERLAEIKRLRAGIQAIIDGSEPKRPRNNPCPHGIPGYETCGNCIDEYLIRLLENA